MTKRKPTEAERTIITIDSNTYVVETVNTLFHSNVFEAKYASINYNIKQHHSENDFPLIISGIINGSDYADLKIRGIACGFAGKASFSAYLILRKFGFKVDFEQLSSSVHADLNGWIRLNFTK